MVSQITINDLPVGRSVDEVLRLIDAFQFTEKYGEVCPVNWNPGDSGIQETVAGRKQYLERQYGATSTADVLMAGEGAIAASTAAAKNGAMNGSAAMPS